MDTLIVSRALWIVATSLLGLLLYDFVRNMISHPLRHIPGPKILATSRVPYIWHHFRGTVPQFLHRLHTKYGEVVRFSPNEVSFITIETAWTDIYGFRTGDRKHLQPTIKDRAWYPKPANGVPSLLIADNLAHSHTRRVFAHGFSNSAMLQQEDTLNSYCNQLIEGLKGTAARKPLETVELTQWYTWITFDVIADLALGAPFACLRDQQTHPYVDLLMASTRAGRFGYIFHYMPGLEHLFRFVTGNRSLTQRAEFLKWTQERVRRRCAENNQERRDFLTAVLQEDPSTPTLSEGEIDTNVLLFLVAGTETTATALSGLSYLLCTNRTAYCRLKHEIRSEWAYYDDISIKTAERLTYLNAIINEALRLFPPIAAGFPRVIPPGGQSVSGYDMPAWTSVSISMEAAHHSTRNFKDPQSFVPERWISGAEGYEKDRVEWMNPFSFGSRACLGKNLANAELRLLVAKLVWTFDFELDKRSNDWLARNRFMSIRQKPPLYIHVSEAQHA